MVIVVPFPNFSMCCKVLESGRLKDMLDYIDQLLGHLPPVDIKESRTADMWRGAPNALADYGNYIGKELLVRGEPSVLVDPFLFKLTRIPYSLPWWFGQEEFHATHRRFLSLRNPKHYGQYWEGPKPGTGYVIPWPKHNPTVEDVIGV